MKSFKEMLEGSHFVSSADFVITGNGRKVHKYQKISSTDYKTRKEEEPVDQEKLNQDADDQRQSKRQARQERDDKKRMDKARELQQNEETILDEATDKEQPPFDPDPVKKNPDAKAGKYGQGYSTARHLARMAIAQMAKKQKQGK